MINVSIFSQLPVDQTHLTDPRPDPIRDRVQDKAQQKAVGGSKVTQ